MSDNGNGAAAGPPAKEKDHYKYCIEYDGTDEFTVSNSYGDVVKGLSAVRISFSSDGVETHLVRVSQEGKESVMRMKEGLSEALGESISGRGYI